MATVAAISACYPADAEFPVGEPVAIHLNGLQSAQDASLAVHMLTTVELFIHEECVTTASCMFDTGALQASFIRKAVVDAHPTIQSNTRDCSVDVTLGDGSNASSVHVSQYVQLRVRCTDANGATHVTPPFWL